MSLRQFVPAEPKRKRDPEHLTNLTLDKLKKAKRSRPEISIIEACRRGNLKVVKWYIEYADYSREILKNHCANHISLFPVNAAIKEGHIEVVELLLAAGADVNQAGDYGDTPLHCASGKGHTEIVKLLLAAGADVNQANNSGWTPLQDSCQSGHSEVVSMLLAAGADVNKAENHGKTPLYIASEYGNTDMVTVLLAAGADVNQTRDTGKTPLYIASQNGLDEVVELLLAAPGIDVNQASNYGETPLNAAIVEPVSTEIVNMLLAAGAEIYKTLFLACKSPNLNVDTFSRLLRQPGIDPNARDELGRTLLMAAVQNNKPRLVDILMADPRVEYEETITLTASQLAKLMGQHRMSKRIDTHRRVQQREANRVFVRRPIDQGDSGKREAPIHIGHRVGSYFHHDVKTKLKF